ncbi:ferric reductase-like transmembrane domain-containing protein [Winogradskyella litoriviva]|uniref:Ferric reductase-like transmembrane domain-containing protein n=1 Tax=Winogradskyella litoriviva TaxID=1220182 RepID=A0ABX2E767_9FLAO|nr:ferric reductase-like transmembrane domain-containing protein [Winogradskyella litoriviva]NRD23982.1 ferric reductase-like transmembrane domain-containing protein [Winogradskyella litoriviva]
MKTKNYIIKFSALIFTFIVVPLFLYFSGNFERRNILMETLSIVTILAFSLLLSQFFTSRLNYKLMKQIRMVNVVAIHRFIGYIFISVILLHPFFIIVPKFFDNTLTPTDAFVRLITTYNTTGIILGLIAYGIMIILMVTAFFRFKMNLHYRTWRSLHGYLTLLFVITATWHVIDMGRHSNGSYTLFYLLVVATGIYYVMRKYLFKKTAKK